MLIMSYTNILEFFPKPLTALTHKWCRMFEHMFKLCTIIQTGPGCISFLLHTCPHSLHSPLAPQLVTLTTWGTHTRKEKSGQHILSGKLGKPSLFGPWMFLQVLECNVCQCEPHSTSMMVLLSTHTLNEMIKDLGVSLVDLLTNKSKLCCVSTCHGYSAIS